MQGLLLLGRDIKPPTRTTTTHGDSDWGGDADAARGYDIFSHFRTVIVQARNVPSLPGFVPFLPPPIVLDRFLTAAQDSLRPGLLRVPYQQVNVRVDLGQEVFSKEPYEHVDKPQLFLGAHPSHVLADVGQSRRNVVQGLVQGHGAEFVVKFQGIRGVRPQVRLGMHDVHVVFCQRVDDLSLSPEH